MNFKTILLIVILLISQTAVGNPAKPQKEQMAELAAENEQLHQDLNKVSAEVERLAGQLESTKSELSKIDEHNFYYIEEYYDRISHFLTVLGLIIAVVSIGLPIYINRQHDKNIQKQLDTASADAADAKQSLDKIQTLQKEIERLKEDIIKDKNQISELQAKIEKDKEASEAAAKQARVSELLSKSYKETDHHKSIELMNEAIELDPECAVAYYNRGCDKSDLGDKKGAITDYDKAIELNSNDAEAYYNRGNAKSDIGDEEGAIKDYNKAIELNPNDAKAYHNRGVVKSDIGDEEGAIKDYDKAIELNPNDAFVYNNKAWSLCCMKEYDTALINVNKSLDIKKTDVSLDTRGVINTNLLRFEEALNDFNEAIGMNSKDAEYYEHRAALYRKMAEQEEDTVKKNDLIKKAEADEAKAEGLKK